MRLLYHPATGYNSHNFQGSENFRERLRRLNAKKVLELNKIKLEMMQFQIGSQPEEKIDDIEELETKLAEIPFNLLHIKI